MRITILSALLICTELLQAQKIKCTVLPEMQKRNECDITSVIPFEDGLLSVVMDPKGNSKYDFKMKLCKINKDHSIEKSIDIGMESEDNMRLVGIYQINKKPIVFYTVYTRRKKVLQIKAAVIDPVSLKQSGVKEVKRMELKEDDQYLIDVQFNEDVDWLSPIKIKMSQDSSKYLLIYDMFCCGPDKQDQKMAYYAVIGENADLLFEKLDILGTWRMIQLKDYCLSKSGKIFSIFQRSTDQPIFGTYYSSYSAFLRLIDITNSKTVDIKIEKNLEFIKHSTLFFLNKDIDAVEIFGSYSKTFDGDLAGGFWISYNNTNKIITEIKKEAFPKELLLTEIYPDYYAEIKKNNSYYYLKPLYVRLRPVYLGLRQNGTIDLTLEYYATLSRTYSSLSNAVYNMQRQSCINFNFSDKKILFTVVPKSQLAVRENYESAIGVFCVPYQDKLLIYYNDVKENLSNASKKTEFNPSSKADNVLVVAGIDKDGNLSKSAVDARFDNTAFPEPPHFKLMDFRNIIFRIAIPTLQKRQKEFNFGFISVN